MKKFLGNLNYLLLIITIIYIAFGLLMIFSASSVAAVLRYQVSTNHFVIRQLAAVLLGLFAGVCLLFIPTGSKIYKWGSYFVFVGIAILVATFTYGKIAGGAKSWLDVGTVNLQPAEFIKILLIMFYAVYYHDITTKKKINLVTMLIPLVIAFVVFVLIVFQPDLGGALIVAAITGLVFISLPIGKKEKKLVYKIGFIGVALILFMSTILGFELIKSYQLSRIVNFTEPCAKYSEDTGYQVCNGYIAIHNGGLTGVGLGNSTQKYLYLPEAHTDFIFPIICEELGLIVGIVVVIGYFILLFTILQIAKNTDNLRNSIIAYGIFAYFLVHILVNLLGILGLIPLTGVPLPFLSYGGSYGVCTIVAVFMLQRIHIENREANFRRKIENL